MLFRGAGVLQGPGEWAESRGTKTREGVPVTWLVCVLPRWVFMLVFPLPPHSMSPPTMGDARELPPSPPEMEPAIACGRWASPALALLWLTLCVPVM